MRSAGERMLQRELEVDADGKWVPGQHVAKRGPNGLYYLGFVDREGRAIQIAFAHKDSADTSRSGWEHMFTAQVARRKFERPLVLPKDWEVSPDMIEALEAARKEAL